MHTHTIRTRFTFGDRVRYDSKLQRCSGTGTIFVISLDATGRVDYIIEVDRGDFSDLQAGVQEDEITLLADVN
jgi:hypothetical protein